MESKHTLMAIAGICLTVCVVAGSTALVLTNNAGSPNNPPVAGYSDQYLAPQGQSFQGGQPFQQYPAPQYRPQPQYQQYQPPQPPVISAQTMPSQPMDNPALDESAGKILEIVSQLDGISDLRGQTSDQAGLAPIQIFFDPRCPFCHRLYDSIAGKAPIHWIPVSALSPADGALPVASALLRAESEGNGAEALAAAFDDSLAGVTPTDEDRATLDQNLGSFSLMMRTLPPGVQAGVPYVMIPKKDGTFESHVGYSTGDENAIIASYGS